MVKITGDWGCGDGSGCGTGNTQKWGPNSIYEISCNKCGKPVEFFKDEKKRRCINNHRVENPYYNNDCC